ncbi:hypothetical protein C8R43DRAFT_1068291 [Mycena crocata]|nr:hypothetical protein C8R43DRAFT_1081946 [Mycena crocata]KAJ7149422.1 hypothetical protein C8R43DRAFT_1068291 [Mycena crocata]
MNLPPELRYLPENVFIVGLLPSPSKPDAVLLKHLLDPIMKTILSYEPPGRKVATHYHPEGVLVQARIIPLIADLPAAREAGGFLSHAAIQYCWFCLLTKDENHRLDHLLWNYRTGQQVRKEAEEWKKLETIKARNAKATETGVRPSSLHLLHYWDPVLYTILGFMHNWLEGILEHQLRVLWGVGRTIQKAKQLLEIHDQENLAEGDMSLLAMEVGSELGSLADDDFNDPTELESLRESLASFGSATPVPSSIDLENEEEWEDVSMDEATEYVDAAVYGNFKLSVDALGKIRTCIKQVSLPTWVARLPDNLGEPKHGKLKAEQFLTLFTAILPLVIPETPLTDDESTSEEMLNGFYELIACTNIISSFETSDSEAESFTEHYKAYRKHVQRTYPDCNEPPNFHYAMHNESLLKYWGPMAGINEFWGERMNGMLQRIKTNRHLYDMDFTMLRQMARRCRLLAHLHNSEFQDPTLKAFTEILDAKHQSKSKDTDELDSFAVAQYLSKVPKMTVKEYKAILSYLNSTGETSLSWLSYPDIEYQSQILPPNAKRLREYHENGRTYSCHSSHHSNSLIQFNEPNTDQPPLTGIIRTILEIPLYGFLRKFILVAPHRPISLENTPYQHFPRMMTALVEIEPYKTLIVIEPKHVITHLSAWIRPSRTYPGVNKRFMTVSWALNRGRK